VVPSLISIITLLQSIGLAQGGWDKTGTITFHDLVRQEWKYSARLEECTAIHARVVCTIMCITLTSLAQVAVWKISGYATVLWPES
jgi:hypothetical protein